MSDMAPDLEPKERSHISQEALGNKELVGMTKELDNSRMSCASVEVGTSKQTEGAGINLDLEINNMLEGTNLGNNKRVERETCDADLTESSSSYDSDGSSFSDAEDDPDLHDDALSAFPLDEFRKFLEMRKKKLTPHWRKYIAPLRWRCKWVALQIKKFEFQAQKYDKEIAEYNKREELETSKSENFDSESLPFTEQSVKKAVFKRKNRRRAEDAEDISSYMSQHNLFSYFENKKTAAAAGAEGNLGNQGAGAEKLSNVTNETGVEFKDGGNSLEQIFWKIGVVQWQVREIKTRVHKVLSENALKFSSNEDLNLLVSCNNSLTSFAENPASPLYNENKTVAAGAAISSDNACDNGDTKMVDVAIPESADLKVEEASHVMENAKSINPPTIEGSSRNPPGTIKMYNRRRKMNQNKPKEINIVSTSKPQESTEDHQASSSSFPSSQVPEPSSRPKFRSISNMIIPITTGTSSFKRKRATRKRKAAPGKWNK